MKSINLSTVGGRTKKGREMINHEIDSNTFIPVERSSDT